MAVEIIVWPISTKKCRPPDVRIKPTTVRIPGRRASDLAAASCWRLMKGLNNYNNVTEWDNWFVCVAVKRKNLIYFWSRIFFDASRIFFYPTFLAHGIFLLKINWCACFFFRHFIFGKVWLLLFNTILNILIVFNAPVNTCISEFELSEPFYSCNILYSKRNVNINDLYNVWISDNFFQNFDLHVN